MTERLLKSSLLLGTAFLVMGSTHPVGPPLVAQAGSLTPKPYIAPSPVIVVRKVVTPISQVYAAPTPSEEPVSGPIVQNTGGLTGSLGYATCGGNCVNEPGVKRQNGNPITWLVGTGTPYIGATALWTYNHTGVVVGLWSNGDVEVRHQNYCSNQHRFPRSEFRGFI